MNSTIEMDFIQAIKEAGLEAPNNIGLDGRFHRFSSDGRPSDNPGWYVLNVLPDCAIAGAFGCWRNGLKKTWSSVEMSTLSKENQRQDKKKLSKTRFRKQNVNARFCKKRLPRMQRAFGKSRNLQIRLIPT